ncbi:MAG: carbohydrate ABC transporter permease [Chloroflexota bacterium]|nr:carbohydrate ABC transporter permease [Chloroflexota bacterium]
MLSQPLPVQQVGVHRPTTLTGLRGTRQRWMQATITYVSLSAGAVVMLVPFVWMVSTSLKTPAEVFVYPPQWLPNPVRWSNYADVVRVMPFARYLANTVFVSGGVTFLQLAVSSLAAYAFARLRFPGRDRLFLAYLATLMVPGQVTLIPNFLIVKYLGWIDSYQALIIPQIFSAFGTFLLRQFFLTIPRELEDAARIDGASALGFFRKILLPLSGPALATLGVFTFTAQWNNFLWPLIVTNGAEMRTLTVGLRALVAQFTVQYQLLMAGTVISLVPMVLVFLLAQRAFVRGIALTGLGGR